jgi:hypothetical protein
MNPTDFSPALPIFLLLAGLGIGVWQLLSAGRGGAAARHRVEDAASRPPLARTDTLRTS